MVIVEKPESKGYQSPRETNYHYSSTDEHSFTSDVTELWPSAGLRSYKGGPLARLASSFDPQARPLNLFYLLLHYYWTVTTDPTSQRPNLVAHHALPLRVSIAAKLTFALRGPLALRRSSCRIESPYY